MIGNDKVKNRNFPDKLKWASMSIASSQLDKGFVELGMDKGEEGGVRDFVCTKLSVGEEMILKGPLGRFVLEDDDKNPILIALGTGITPLMSMIRTLIAKESKKKITLLYSIKNSELFLFGNEIIKLEEENENFESFVTVTREDASWKGLRGRMQNHLKDIDFGDKGKRIVYLCGSPKGVLDIIDTLKEIGFSSEQIKKEQW
jgi:Na+-transporting NADH:ubiquinone oxidoreductase subunit F